MSSGGKKLRVLIADDHELVRQGTRAVLRDHPGWQVVGEAVDGRDAVQKAQELKPDLAILDIGLPNLDGLEVTREIVERSPETKVLVLTMHESGQMVRRVLEAGARGYVLKSDMAATLVRAVREVLDGKLSLTPRVAAMVSQASAGAGTKAKQNAEPIRLTAREIQVIRLLAQGKSNKESASLLNISTRTVEAYRARIMRKLEVKSAAELIRYAIREKIVEA